MFTVYERFVQLIALVILVLLLFTYAPRIATTLSEKLVGTADVSRKMKVSL
jgi:accessory gene regulator protein AgrB